ncbi:hypothetical protein RclHR1_08450002 [Rhizophagus clarus]|uniref:Crinkler effector protein N-terminal domain-containing protein n=2 Tax=Rhizophagus clarus TaxID=94130 RepID=A0A2Z6S132_9GLOM|nr:hypothetical protein RclHR1_08450002 [Rhizophagus clarus]
MSTITLSCLVVGENPYENVFKVDIDNNKTINRLKDAIKENQKPFFDNIASKELKLWKVDISLKEENKKLELVNTKINVNIKEDLGGEELPPLSKISKHFPSQPADEHIHIIVQRPVETKEVYCTATRDRERAYRNRLCNRWRWLEEKNFDSIIWTTNPKVDLEIVVNTFNLCMAVFVTQQPFSLYIFPKMKAVFGLKADDYNRLSLFDRGVKDTPKEIRSLVINELLRLHKTSQHITSANEATRCKFISRIIYGVASIFDGEVKVYPQYEISGSHRKDQLIGYDTAGLHKDVMYEIVSTAVDWVIIKLVSSSSKNNSEGKVEVLLSSLSPSSLPINNSVLTREDLAKPVKNLFGQIKWVFDSQIEL